MLGGRSSTSGPGKAKVVAKKTAPGSQGKKAAGMGDIRGFLVNTAKFEQYDPQMHYHFFKIGEMGTHDVVALPFTPPHDMVMVMGRRSGSDNKHRQPGAPFKVDLGIRSDEHYISRQAALVTLTPDNRFTLTNPAGTLRPIMLRRSIRGPHDKDAVTLAPGDAPLALKVGDEIVLDGSESQPKFKWRFDAFTPGNPPIGATRLQHQQQQALQSPTALSASSASSTGSAVRSQPSPHQSAIQAAVRQSGPENLHPNQPMQGEESPSRAKKPLAVASSMATAPSPSAAPASRTGKSKEEPMDAAAVKPEEDKQQQQRKVAAASSASSTPAVKSASATKAPRPEAVLGSPEKPICLLSDSDDDEEENERPPAKPRAQAAGARGRSREEAKAEPVRRSNVVVDLTGDEVELLDVRQTARFAVDQNVLVTERTGPGQNKPGGFGRVVAVHETDAGFRFDVKYILGGCERMLPPELMTEAQIVMEPRGRKRSSEGSRQSTGSDAGQKKVCRKSSGSTAEPMQVVQQMGPVSPGGADWEVLKRQDSEGGSQGQEEEEEDEEEEEGGAGAEAEGGRDLMGLGEGRAEVKLRCTLCNKAFTLKGPNDTAKMHAHLEQCLRVKVKREREEGHGMRAAKEMPSSLSVCFDANLSVPDPSFLLSSLERWVLRTGQTVSLRFHQGLVKALLETACPLRARCFRRMLGVVQDKFPSHAFSSSWRPIDLMAFTDLLRSVNVRAEGHAADARRLRSRVLTLDYMTNVFEGEVADLRRNGLYNDADCRKGTMLATLMLSVKGDRANTVGRRLSSVMDLTLDACAHDYVRAGGRSRTARLAVPRGQAGHVLIGKDVLKWFEWGDGPEVAAAEVLARALLLMCEVYQMDNSRDCDEDGYDADTWLENRVKLRRGEERDATERTLYRYMPGRARELLPRYASWEQDALGDLYADIKDVGLRVDQIATTEHCGRRVSLTGLTLPRAQALLLVLLCAWLPGAVTSILLGKRPATVKAFQLSCRPVRRFVGHYGYQKGGAHTFGSHFVSRERSFASRTLVYGAGSTLRDGVLQGKDARYASSNARVLEPELYEETEQRPVPRRQRKSEPQQPYKGQTSPYEPSTESAKTTPWELPKRDDVPGVTVVRDRKSAERALAALYKHKDAIFACDTEVADIDVKVQGPVGNGNVICLSVYGGPDVDFGEGSDKVLWVENMDESEGILDEFKGWLEDPNTKKAWHNYGFDRHVLYNHDIDCQGLVGDTMHMARLWDTSRDRYASNSEEDDTGSSNKGYSLEALSKHLVPSTAKSASMKELFGQKKLRKDGSEGSLVVLPELRMLQRDDRFRARWIQYSADDALSTWNLRRVLEHELRGMSWKDGRNMYEFYVRYLAPFAVVLTDMERIGIRVDARDYLANIQKKAQQDQEEAAKKFLGWASKFSPDNRFINPGSSAQIQTFLFGGSFNARANTSIPHTRKFKVEITDLNRHVVEEAQREAEARLEAEGPPSEAGGATGMGPQDGGFEAKLKTLKVAALKELCKEKGLKVTGKKEELIARLLEGQGEDHLLNLPEKDLRDMCIERGLPTEGPRDVLVRRVQDDVAYVMEMSWRRLAAAEAKKKKEKDAENAEKRVKKSHEFSISSLGYTPNKFTAGGAPAVTADVLRTMAGNPSTKKWGTAYDGTPESEEACEALFALCQMGSIDTMLSNFLIPLQELVDDKSRVHCSLNLNTETGRLSSRRPNLQNQPALEKDQYKIRRAFVSEPGKSLVVADYGQLELRLLAHITDCESMLMAFKEGGCFHSRTAVGMFDHVRQAVESGEVLLEWDYSKGKPPAPLVKDKYGSERRKAKTLNFSIAYGKTAHGLSKDWGVSQQEAEELLKAWYADRPEVKRWQDMTIKTAHQEGWTRTLMGRYRKLPDIKSHKRALRGHGERAAINTPIQGGAADVVMMAMLKIHNSQKLKDIGWKLLLQIHDEVIVEGPDETAEEALAEVKRCMENPWDEVGLPSLRVKLEVDAKCAKSWYEAK